MTYGKLAYVEKEDTNGAKNYEQIAENKLDELNVESEELNVSIIGNYLAGKGKIIPLNFPDYDLSGNFLITKAKHSITNEKHEIDLTLKRRPI